MARLSAYELDLDAERDGVWHDLQYGLRVRLARIGTERFRRAQEQAAEPHKERYPIFDLMPEDLRRSVNMRAFASACVTDWNAEDDAGQPLACTADEVYQVLANPAYRDLWNQLWALAFDGDYYRARRAELLGGNLPGGSGGRSRPGRKKG